MVTRTDCNFKPKETERLTDLKSREEREYLLYSAWSCVLTKSESECLLKLGISKSSLPKAPHLENCKVKTQLYDCLDKRTGNHSFPPWTSWKGLLDTHPAAATTEQIKILRRQAVLESAYPPWIAGSDEENYPLTRKVQRDIWIHQHPLNCNNPNVKFLLADWERLPGFGIGAQIAGMCGLLAIAINERRVLVTNFYNRADHDGCKGMINYCDQYYGTAVRYLMRFPTEYTCNLLNEARHAAFGKIAAEMVLESPAEEWPEENRNKSGSGIEEYVWSNHKPWIPRPLLSIHVRMGDKACEMKVVEFEEYMQLADRIRRHFPNLNSIWLSTEMQEVIDKIKEYSGWNFHYTKVRRQGRTNVSMAKYEASLGRESSTNYPLVNFMMAADSDFFVGALGSTWCFLIDGMRNTGGKVMAGYLSVNKDRFW
ncbi:hypothetical protein JHK87_008330 [Glycine soja]|nr:hypothetical protein JHK87_008330 [Glycine soja]